MFEQHGPHLPLSTDTLIATEIAHRIASHYPLLELPAITVSCSHEHAGFSATVYLSAKTLYTLLDDIYSSLVHQGITKLFLINAHGGNYVLHNFTQENNLSQRNIAIYPTRSDWEEARTNAGLISSHHEDMHAGELETSLLLATHPDSVKPQYLDADMTVSDRRHLNILGMKGYSETGVIGKPSYATAEKGSKVLEYLINNFDETYKLLY